MRTNDQILGDQARKVFSELKQYEAHQPTDDYWEEKRVRRFCQAMQEASHIKALYEADPSASLALANLNYDFEAGTFTHTLQETLDCLGELTEFYLYHFERDLKSFLASDFGTAK